MPMHALFKTLIGKRVRIELKNSLNIAGELSDIDTFFNFKLANIEIETNPLNVSLLFKKAKNMFIRGSSVKLIWISEENVNIHKLEDATRKGMLFKKLLLSEREKEEASVQ
ncbi:U6 snRNA-associated Sm-like protein LSm2 [Nematocida minor]|uniref:U6 snRNA-associated Sm-like protein LSm2 n=1 Tax=Nematocida minor TaxID=1912983 RepID=UPI00221FBAE8|nr:U6 snRNA-associated Sm-like protein LSm2 [Nematocida minor]KAI5189915.1 U6 snRNA-associated Sm-like protein LSm2 [Nematocida minor]